MDMIHAQTPEYDQLREIPNIVDILRDQAGFRATRETSDQNSSRRSCRQELHKIALETLHKFDRP